MKENNLSEICRVAMLSTGDEVLKGDISDTNATWLSRTLFEAGFSLHRRVTVGDKLDDIAIELIRASQCSEIVIVNGGLGPTTDDLTTEAMALAMNVDLELNSDWLTVMQKMYQRKGKVMPESNIKQAMLPVGAELLDNPVGTACGFSAKLNDCQFFFTPGVPHEFRRMITQQILPRLQHSHPVAEQIHVHYFYSLGLSESSLNDQIHQFQLPEGIHIGYRSDSPMIEVKVFYPELSEAAPAVLEAVRTVLGEHLVGDAQNMQSHLAGLLEANDLSYSFAEKFSAGQMQNWSSESDALQARLAQAWILSPNSMIPNSENNPFSEALVMASMCRSNAKTDLAMACGPCEKNQVAIVLSSGEGDWAVLVEIDSNKDIQLARRQCALFAMDLMRRYLEGKNVFPQEFSLPVIDTLFIPLN